MSIVTADQAESARLDVVVLHARDAEAAAAGGADRLLLTAEPDDGHWSPDPGPVSAVLKETGLLLLVSMRPHEGDHRDGPGERERLQPERQQASPGQPLRAPQRQTRSGPQRHQSRQA